MLAFDGRKIVPEEKGKAAEAQKELQQLTVAIPRTGTRDRRSGRWTLINEPGTKSTQTYFSFSLLEILVKP